MIINYKDVTERKAVYYTLRVIEEGRISADNQQYCFVTQFRDGTSVYADKTKTGTDTFRVYGEVEP